MQINHVHKTDARLHNRMVVVVGKKIFDNVMPLESAFFVKGNRERAVACSDLKGVIAIMKFFFQKFNQLFAVAFSLAFGNGGDVLY